MLVPFCLPDGVWDGEVLRPCFPLDVGYTQPDVSLLSDRHRIFLELKWNAHVTLEQVQKYLLLHADLDGSDGPRQALHAGRGCQRFGRMLRYWRSA